MKCLKFGSGTGQDWMRFGRQVEALVGLDLGQKVEEGGPGEGDP